MRRRSNMWRISCVFISLDFHNLFPTPSWPLSSRKCEGNVPRFVNLLKINYLLKIYYLITVQTFYKYRSVSTLLHIRQKCEKHVNYLPYLALLYDYAQLLLFRARIYDETGNLDSGALLEQYKNVVCVCNELEGGHFFLAKYLDKLFELVKPTQNDAASTSSVQTDTRRTGTPVSAAEAL